MAKSSGFLAGALLVAGAAATAVAQGEEKVFEARGHFGSPPERGQLFAQLGVGTDGDWTDSQPARVGLLVMFDDDVVTPDAVMRTYRETRDRTLVEDGEVTVGTDDDGRAQQSLGFLDGVSMRLRRLDDEETGWTVEVVNGNPEPRTIRWLERRRGEWRIDGAAAAADADETQRLFELASGERMHVRLISDR